MNTSSGFKSVISETPIFVFVLRKLICRTCIDHLIWFLVVHLFDTQTGKPLGDGKPFEHKVHMFICYLRLLSKDTFNQVFKLKYFPYQI